VPVRLIRRGGIITASDPEISAPINSGAAIRGVLGVTAFRRLWYATALSSLGDWLGLLATTALAASLAHGHVAQGYALSGVLVIRLLPAIMLGPVAGVFADRFDRRRTMVISDAIRFGLFLTIPLVHTISWLLIASFLIECVSLFWMPAKDAAAPNLVRREQIEPANQLSLVTTYGITPVLGAVLFSLLSLITNVLARHVHFFRAQPVNLALYFNAGTFLFGAIVVFFIREISGHREGKAPDDQPSMLSLAREGASFVRHSRLIGGLISSTVVACSACPSSSPERV
jgi:dTMP kinase